jgi:hypothetical protein
MYGFDATFITIVHEERLQALQREAGSVTSSILVPAAPWETAPLWTNGSRRPPTTRRDRNRPPSCARRPS